MNHHRISFTPSARHANQGLMNVNGHLVLWVVGLIMACLAAALLYRWLNPDQRESRKRRRNYGKVVPRVKRPMVILNAKTKKDKS